MQVRYIPFLWRWLQPRPLPDISSHPQAWRLAKLRMTTADLQLSVRGRMQSAGISRLAQELESSAIPERIEPEYKEEAGSLPEPRSLDDLLKRYG
jgi:hypothetical protein